MLNRVLREFLLFLAVAVPSGIMGLLFATFVLQESNPDRAWYDLSGLFGYGLYLAVRRVRSGRHTQRRSTINGAMPAR